MSLAASTRRPAALRVLRTTGSRVGRRHDIGSPVGRLTWYSAALEIDSRLLLLMLIPSVNPAGSAFETNPLYDLAHPGGDKSER